jgi:hypothetical protein
MINGPYHVKIVSGGGDVTNCVAVLNEGIVQGGDSVTCFAGTIKFENEKFIAELNTRKYASLDDYEPIFGPHPAKVTVNGTTTAEDAAVGIATSPQAPGVAFHVELKYLHL